MYGAKTGNQYAELNAEAAGALYQDVMTVPGTSLNWQFSHRGRDGNDTMYLVIAPTSVVAGITTQEQLMNFIRVVQQNPQSYAGCYVISKTDGNQAWGMYRSADKGNEPYKVPVNQYLTRFFFVAGNTASGKDTVGNLLDDVAFTTGLLPAEPGTANLTVTKKVVGIDPSDIDDYSVSVQVNGGGKNETLTLNEFTQQSDGSFMASGSVTGITVEANTQVQVGVSESASDVSGYTKQSSTVSANDSSATDGTSTTVTLSEKQNGTVTFTNTYAKNTVPVTIPGIKETKKVDSRNASAYAFTFKVQAIDDETSGTEAAEAAKKAGLSGLPESTEDITDSYDSASYTYTFKNPDNISTDSPDDIRTRGTGLTFDDSDVDKTYTYVYSEDDEMPTGWSQIGATQWRVQIAVTKDGANVKATVTVSERSSDDGQWEIVDGYPKEYTGTNNTDIIDIGFENAYVVVSALPLTGGDMTARVLVLAGGGVLLVAGVAWLLARRRRV